LSIQRLRGRTTLKLSSVAVWIALTLVAALFCGCSVSQKTVVKPANAPAPLLTASKAELIGRYNQQAQSVTSLNAGVSMKLTAGSAYSGVIEQYHEINGFVLAAGPANIRVIGQAPVVGKPIPEGAPVLFEEASEGSNRFYILTAVLPASDHNATKENSPGSPDWEISRKIWFDRTNLQIARVENFAYGGKVASDVHYSNWLATTTPSDTAAPPTATPAANGIMYPRHIAISRPSDDYQLAIEIKKLTINEPIAADRFVLNQPPGTKLIHPDEDAKEPQKP
jgi:hypothetical protein